MVALKSQIHLRVKRASGFSLSLVICHWVSVEQMSRKLKKKKSIFYQFCLTFRLHSFESTIFLIRGQIVDGHSMDIHYWTVFLQESLLGVCVLWTLPALISFLAHSLSVKMHVTPSSCPSRTRVLHLHIAEHMFTRGVFNQCTIAAAQQLWLWSIVCLLTVIWFSSHVKVSCIFFFFFLQVHVSLNDVWRVCSLSVMFSVLGYKKQSLLRLPVLFSSLSSTRVHTLIYTYYIYNRH